MSYVVREAEGLIIKGTNLVCINLGRAGQVE